MRSENSRFVLLFNSSLGRTISLSVPRACNDKSATAAQASMEAIIATGAVASGGKGTPISVKNVKRVTTVHRDI
jgi:hypothetical protein